MFSYFSMFWRSSKTPPTNSPNTSPNNSPSSPSSKPLDDKESLELKSHLRTLESFNEDLHSILSNCSKYQTDCACSITVSYDSTALPEDQYKIRMNCDYENEAPDFVKVTNEILAIRSKEKVKNLLAKPYPSFKYGGS